MVWNNLKNSKVVHVVLTQIMWVFKIWHEVLVLLHLPESVLVSPCHPTKPSIPAFRTIGWIQLFLSKHIAHLWQQNCLCTCLIRSQCCFLYNQHSHPFAKTGIVGTALKWFTASIWLASVVTCTTPISTSQAKHWIIIIITFTNSIVSPCYYYHHCHYQSTSLYVLCVIP